MKIDHVETRLVPAGGGWRGGVNCLVRVSTDTGLSGFGQSATFAYPSAVAAVVADFEPVLLGQDPLRTEHLWQVLYRVMPFRGNILHAAVSAIDIALWDLKGRHFETPVYELLGGRSRDRVRLSRLILGDGHDPADMYKLVAAAVADGFTAVKVDPLPSECGDSSLPDLLSTARATVAAAREAAGRDVDVALEFGRKLTAVQALPIIECVAPFEPLFVEDILHHDSIQSQAELAKRTNLPLAFGERLTSIWEFRELLQAAGAVHLRPDVGTAGGLTHCKKIAALAESYNAPITSHNWLGPLLSSASIHLDVSIPNFVVQEYDPADEDRSDYGMFRSSLQREGGYMLAPTAPGLGVDVAWDELETDPPAGFDLKGQAARMIRPDGSMGGPA